MATPGQPQDPVEACIEGRPLLHPGELVSAGRYAFRIQGPHEYSRPAALAHPDEWWGEELTRRWNLHHELLAVIADLLPLADAAAGGFRGLADETVKFAQGVRPPSAGSAILATAMSEAEEAEAAVKRAREALKEAVRRELRPLKPRTLHEQAAAARKLQQASRTDRDPSWGDEQLRRELHLIAVTLDWALRKGRDPVQIAMAAAEDRRKQAEKAARARAEAVDGL